MTLRVSPGTACSHRVAFWALAGAVASMAAMPWLLWADEIVYRWLQFHRTCATPQQADGLQLVVVGLLAVLVVIAMLARGLRHPAELAAAVTSVAAGAAVGELLKTAFERLRPRALPITTGANSFPSGHVMNTTLIAIAAYVLIRRSTAPRWLRALACTCVVASICGQAAARVLHGSHWVSDIPGETDRHRQSAGGSRGGGVRSRVPCARGAAIVAIGGRRRRPAQRDRRRRRRFHVSSRCRRVAGAAAHRPRNAGRHGAENRAPSTLRRASARLLRIRQRDGQRLGGAPADDLECVARRSPCASARRPPQRSRNLAMGSTQVGFHANPKAQNRRPQA